MAGWTGFTDEDLQAVRGDLFGVLQPSPSVKPSKVGQQPRRKVREKIMTTSTAPTVVSSEPSPSVTSGPGNRPSKGVVNAIGTTDGRSDSDAKPLSKPPSEENRKIGILSDEKVAEIQLSSLEMLQKKQKEMEDENNRRKQLIKSTVQERLRKTQQETQTLKIVQRELALIDSKLHSEVESLRTQIDDASCVLSHAQKRFERAEAEYVAAKLDFHQKKECKDKLTESLYAIIQENELRKASKLEEIMTKLQVDVTTGGDLTAATTSGQALQRSVSMPNGSANSSSLQPPGEAIPASGCSPAETGKVLPPVGDPIPVLLPTSPCPP